MSQDPQPFLPQLFISFLRLGLTAFGGPSMVAYIRKLTVGQKHWLDAETFNSGVALCQMLPGATASFIGFGLPAFLLMTLLAGLYASTHSLPAVTAAFSGLQAIIVALIANAAMSFGRATLKNWKHFVIAGGAAALFGLNVNPILVIGLAALGGLALVQPRPTAPPKVSSSAPMPLHHQATDIHPGRGGARLAAALQHSTGAVQPGGAVDAY